MSIFDNSMAGSSVCLVKGRLSGVKHGIFNPDLPTFRQMERDDMMCRLPEEHCRHTTRVSGQQFLEATMSPFLLSQPEVHCLAITDTGRAVTRHCNTVEDLQDAHKIWSRAMKCRSDLPQSKPVVKYEPIIDDWHFNGVMLRVIKPELRDWRQTFRCEPGLDPSGLRQRATPSNTNYRHRALASDLPCDVAICSRRTM